MATSNLPNNAVNQAAKNKAEAFDTLLEVTKSNSNVLSVLQGPKGSKMPVHVDTRAEKGQLATVNFNVATSLGQDGRRGGQVGLGFEEGLIHGAWSVTLDLLRVFVSWAEIQRVLNSSSGSVWEEVYAQLCGERIGQIEQEDTFMRFRQRSGPTNTIRPGSATSLNTLQYDDLFDTQVIERAIQTLRTNGAKPVMIAKDKASGMPISSFCGLGPSEAVRSVWQDSLFTDAVTNAEVRGTQNPMWTDNIPIWKGSIVKPWDIVNHDNPGPIGSSVMPQAKLGDPITDATTALTVYGGGRTQAALGADQAALYAPFCYFYGANYRFGELLTFGADAGPYHFIVIDPADGLWCLYEYAGSTGINTSSAGAVGNSITCTKRLAAATSGTAFETIGGWTFDPTFNKVAFPTGSLIVQVNSNVVPVADTWFTGAGVAGKCYGKYKNDRVSQSDDYTERRGLGIRSIYGVDVARDTQDVVRGIVRVQTAYELPGYSLPQI